MIAVPLWIYSATLICLQQNQDQENLEPTACNTGVLKTDHQAKVPGYGNVWFDESSIADVFSLTKMVKKHRVQFDSAVENTFVTAHGPKGIIKFSCTPDNLHAFVLKHKTGTDFNLINTAEENKCLNSNCKVLQAEQAKKLLSAHPTLSESKAIIQTNQI